MDPHPLFREFIKASLKYEKGPMSNGKKAKKKSKNPRSKAESGKTSSSSSQGRGVKVAETVRRPESAADGRF